MKKKQLAKLKQQFRPSFTDARQQLFHKMEEKAQEDYQLNLRVFLNGTEGHEMRIELLQPTERDQQIKVPLDENFTTVVKRIQNQEKGLLDRFSTNLVEEVASYWIPEQTRSTPTIATTDGEKTTAFIKEIESFPKFTVKESDTSLEIYEETGKEPRLLASVSKVEENTRVIESALERKYKLKLEVIPVIDAYAAVPLAER